MKNILINEKNYTILKDYNDAIVIEEIKEKLTDYFEDFDYVVGDWAYGKLRLKGFYEKENPKSSPINTIDEVENYLKNYCSYGCKYFILKKD